MLCAFFRGVVVAEGGYGPKALGGGVVVATLRVFGFAKVLVVEFGRSLYSFLAQ